MFLIFTQVEAGCFERRVDMHTGKSELQMQRTSALFGMVSHHQAPAFTDFAGLTISMFNSKSDIASKRLGNDDCGAQPCRSPDHNPDHVHGPSPMRVTVPAERFGAQEKPQAHQVVKGQTAYFPLATAQGKFLQRTLGVCEDVANVLEVLHWLKNKIRQK